MTSPWRRNARRGPRAEPRRKGGSERAGTSPAHEWVWGVHAVRAALANPARGAPERILFTAERAREFTGVMELVRPVIASNADIAQEIPAGAVHQGAAVLAGVLAAASLSDLAEPAEGMLVMLDQLTDPQNVGAIFRSAAAFGARGVILQERHAPPLSGALAKVAAGAVDKIPHARVVNLSRALNALAGLGWRAVGLAADAPDTLTEALDGAPTVFVLGSEGDGLRRLVSDHCDVLARIPMAGAFDSLNVASAAAVALYAGHRRRA